MQDVYLYVGMFVFWLCVLFLACTALWILWKAVSNTETFMHVLQKDMWLTSNDLELSKETHPKVKYKNIRRLIIAINSEKNHIQFGWLKKEKH